MSFKYWAKLSDSAVPLYLFQELSELEALCKDNTSWQQWLKSTGFEFSPGQVIGFPSPTGQLAVVVAVGSQTETSFMYLSLYQKIPAGVYQLQRCGCVASEKSYKQAILLFSQAAYDYTLEGDEPKEPKLRFLLPETINFDKERITIEAIDLVRDLINAPANYMQPPDLFLATNRLCKEYGAVLIAIQGRDLLTAGYEAIYRVGQVGSEPPCLLDFSWGDESHPSVTLIGKGVCFDSGGLSLKTANGMLTMKKDMGGAAHVLGLAKIIMANQLPVRLRVLIPAVENGIGKGAYRPGDVLRYQNGTTVEITNTDAEGRLILADAILAACSGKKPDLLIDFSTLTGAARVAVGMDIAAFFTTQVDVIADFMNEVSVLADPVWPLPLYSGYKPALKSYIADMVNSTGTPHGAAITAALFLQHFVPPDVNWWHFDVSAWAEGVKPGGAAMGIRAMYAWLEKKFA
jgi:leucyl aminopeptidase